jgi:hypothetical protein
MHLAGDVGRAQLPVRVSAHDAQCFADPLVHVDGAGSAQQVEHTRQVGGCVGTEMADHR